MTAIPSRFPATPNDLWTHVIGASTHMDLGCRLTFDRPLDAEVLRRAVRLSLDSEPVLGCSLETGWYAAHWQRRGDLDERVPFAVTETTNPDADERAFRTQRVPDAGPQAAVLLLRSPDRDDVCVKVSHVPADGQAVKQYACLLAELYTRLAADPSFTPPPNLAPRPAGIDALAGMSAEQRKALRPPGSPLMPNWDIPAKGSDGKRPTRLALTLPPDRFLSVKAYGRDRGASVNDMLLTAFFRALLKSFPQPDGRTMSFTSTADHRRFLPSAEGIPITNISISGFLGLEHVAGETFDETLARVAACMREWRDTGYGVTGQKQAASLAKLGVGTMRTLYGMMGRMSARSGKSMPLFTNFGVLDASRLSFAGTTPVAGCLTGPAPSGSNMVPTISTFLDTLTVSMGFCEDDMDAALVEAVLADTAAELPNPAGISAETAEA